MFELSATTLRLGIGDRAVSYAVAGTRHRDSADATLYTIRYRDGESMLELGVFVSPDSVVHLRNLADVDWTRPPR